MSLSRRMMMGGDHKMKFYSYLQSTGTQWINLYFPPRDGMKIVVRSKKIEHNSRCAVGGSYPALSSRGYFTTLYYYSYGLNPAYKSSDIILSSWSVAVGDRIEVEWNCEGSNAVFTYRNLSSGVTRSNTYSGRIDAKTPNTGSMAAFGGIGSMYVNAKPWETNKANIEEILIYVWGELVRDFVPASIGGLIGLNEMCGNISPYSGTTLFTNQGTGNFITGTII